VPGLSKQPVDLDHEYAGSTSAAFDHDSKLVERWDVPKVIPETTRQQRDV
jgi:hypothetical protein